MRGKLLISVMQWRGKRNIPAYAGKTIPKPPTPYGTQEHPRVCGENGGTGVIFGGSWGTSPRMRGKPYHQLGTGLCHRNIPAYAGKTITALILKSYPAEHPRVCGENKTAHFLSAIATGTSPRMRGKPYHQLGTGLCHRNIPAYAGKTLFIAFYRFLAAEHPRVCGENTFQIFLRISQVGTSPRMRGKLLTESCFKDETRNIPAYAGKTSCK